MKYMGSKRSMLLNGLGESLTAEAASARRFVDLFTGSGVVASFVATRFDVEVVAADLQLFAVKLADAVVSRNKPFTPEDATRTWIARARSRVRRHATFEKAKRLQEALSTDNLEHLVSVSRELCADPACGPTQSAYGGYYFSPLQALWIDSLRKSVPSDLAAQRVGLAALIRAASQCVAAPGHTAQPFTPNETAGPFLVSSWQKDIVPRFVSIFADLAGQSAKRRGKALVANAVEYAEKLKEGDLVFIDPPYSAVHYSRFYHVLETIAAGEHIQVSGIGRYPPLSSRPVSDFSIKTKSRQAFCDLLSKVSTAGARAIVTFPEGSTSNGLSGQEVADLASEYFSIEKASVSTLFSTLGGNRIKRDARHSSRELILTLNPMRKR